MKRGGDVFLRVERTIRSPVFSPFTHGLAACEGLVVVVSAVSLLSQRNIHTHSLVHEEEKKM